ncbi:glucose-6-phosphate isomerase [Rubellimicrobium thermophilum DSM 16684]|uniref:glucose-6-phosphate isomerase n=1 Tax=Rubellimicrobium thermophilum DSM 16684 TaxID=1123069 RepID=S9SBV6_9RHOB|nr:glucose-6-phosphate isomerase [Rubellimicrobium thermophilum]EPX83714.1 glucose-6-phosphate isomerase [Rubellimicrobium thermophilum DSM 16684]
MSLAVDPERGRLLGAEQRYAKSFGDLAGLYADRTAFEALLASRRDEIAYEVTAYVPGDRVNDLIVGVTRMVPGRVGREFFMTRGHIHARADRPEIYHGQSGHGLMLMESPAGEIRIAKIGPGSLCYVPPFWIHRSVNIGDTDLVMLFAYPADSGQDYGIIERSGGMRVRIMADGRGGWTQEPNPHWRPRSAAEIARIHAGPEAAA